MIIPLMRSLKMLTRNSGEKCLWQMVIFISLIWFLLEIIIFRCFATHMFLFRSILIIQCHNFLHGFTSSQMTQNLILWKEKIGETFPRFSSLKFLPYRISKLAKKIREKRHLLMSFSFSVVEWNIFHKISIIRNYFKWKNERKTFSYFSRRNFLCFLMYLE